MRAVSPALYREVESLVAEFLADNQDEDVALRTEGRFVKQLASASAMLDDQRAETQLVNTNNKAVALEIGNVGQINSLFYRESRRRVPEADEVLSTCAITSALTS